MIRRQRLPPKCTGPYPEVGVALLRRLRAAGD